MKRQQTVLIIEDDESLMLGLEENLSVAEYRVLTATTGAGGLKLANERKPDLILLDLSLNPTFVEELLEGLTRHVLETMGVLFARFRFDGIAVSDDYGTQKSMVMSPAHWRRFVKPHLARIYAFAKERGRAVFHHSCGNLRPVIGDLVDMGLDILHPVQPEAMDPLELKREFGRHLTFCGGVGTQRLLPFATPGEVRAEVRRLKAGMGAGGGYILEPGITLQADIPLGNLLALIEEARVAG